MKDPLVGPLAAIASGIVAARFVAFLPTELYLAIAAFLLLGTIAVWRASRVVAGACCLLGFFCAGALIALANAPGQAPELTTEGREVVILGGCVVEPPAISDERERFLLELEPHARVQVTLYSRSGEPLPALQYGQNIELEARVRKPRNFGNPGAFDYAGYLSRQEIYWTASGAANTVRILEGRCGSRFQKFVMDLRQAALARIERLYAGDAYRAGMIQAILIGQSYQLQKVWTEEYRSTGTFHALVISGSHVAVLAAVFVFALRLCGAPVSVALLATVPVAWLYALVTGWQTPCVRSAAGLTLFTICGYFYRERRPMNLLAAVALGFLVFDPAQLFEASFQLTFLAVACLAAFAIPLIRATSGPLAWGSRSLSDTNRDLRLEPRVAQFRVEMRLLAETGAGLLGRTRGMPLWLVSATARTMFFIYEIVAVSAIVQVGLVLPMVVYFHRVGISGLSANVAVVPLMSAVVPVGFLAILTGWTWVAQIASGLLWASQKWVHWHANVEPGWRIPTPPLWLVVALAVSLIGAASVQRPKLRAVAGAVVSVLLALLLWRPWAPTTAPGQLEMTAIDVGQGDSIFLVFPDGKRLLIDGGGIPAFGPRPRSNLDIGEDVVAPYLWDRGFRTVDAIALSHAHEDHSGGLPALIAAFRPKELWTGATPASRSWNAVREASTRMGVQIMAMTSGQSRAYGGAEIEVLAPFPDYIPADTPKNNDSLVLRVRYGQHAFLLAGDMERQIERRMLSQEEIRHADVLKVAHHGSRTSTTEEFLSAVSPAFAIVSAGFENSYGHPHRDVVERLARHGVMTLRTDRHGLIAFRSDGRRLDVQTHSGFLDQR